MSDAARLAGGTLVAIDAMNPVENWWSEVSSSTRDWLAANVREPLMDDVAVDIVRHGGGVIESHTPREPGSRGHFGISEDDWRWIERLHDDVG